MVIVFCLFLYFVSYAVLLYVFLVLECSLVCYLRISAYKYHLLQWLRFDSYIRNLFHFHRNELNLHSH